MWATDSMKGGREECRPIRSSLVGATGDYRLLLDAVGMFKSFMWGLLRLLHQINPMVCMEITELKIEFGQFKGARNLALSLSQYF